MLFFRVSLIAAAPLLFAAAAAAQSTTVFASPGSLIAELRLLEQSVEDGGARTLSRNLPDFWAVEASGRRYSIPTAPLRSIASSNARSSDDQARRWLDNLAAELESYHEPSSAPQSARTQLNQILARREFAAVRPPTWWQLIEQRFLDWLVGIIRSIVSFAKAHPTGGTILFWLASAAAVAVLVFLLLRFWTHRNQAPLSQQEPAPVSRTWQQWIHAAKVAADRGDLREAIHCAYWAAVIRLQDAQLLPADSTRTPREYLRLIPAAADSLAPLAALTSALERFWYAAHPATADDLRQSFDHLEALGCRLD